MALNLVHLDSATRKHMLEELDSDINSGGLYLSSRLSLKGVREYPELLRAAIAEGDDSTLARNLTLGGRMNATETRNTKTGRIITASVPSNANETLAEGEFNRYYIRGVCRRVLEDGHGGLEICRGQERCIPTSGISSSYWQTSRRKSSS